MSEIEARMQAASEFLTSEYLVARLCEAVTTATAAANSPWLNRKAAAAYAQCSVSELDRAADAGAFRRYWRSGTPLFRKDEINAAIVEGRWPTRRAAVPPVPAGETDRRVKALMINNQAEPPARTT